MKNIINQIKNVLVKEKGETDMTKAKANTKGKTPTQSTEEPKNKRQGSLVTYVYGQIYRGFLESDKAKKFTIKNIHVREWKKILGWLKSNEYIVEFKLGDTFETACELEIEGFDSENLIYVNYLKAIERNMAKEVA